MRIQDHGDFQNLWSPSQELSNDVSYVDLSENFKSLNVRGLRFEMVYFYIRMSSHGDIHNLWSPSQALSNDVSYVGLSETFIIST